MTALHMRTNGEMEGVGMWWMGQTDQTHQVKADGYAGVSRGLDIFKVMMRGVIRGQGICGWVIDIRGKKGYLLFGAG